MRITDILNGGRSLSFEVFPPKNSDTFENIRASALEIADLSPSYMSVTYGAGGTTDAYTGVIAEEIQKRGVTSLAHLSCISSTKAKIISILDDLKRRGVENILALRGDLPDGVNAQDLEYRYASMLAEEIKRYGGFCIGGACYPEGHPESKSEAQDLESLRIKVAAGCEFLTTQMFFENAVLYRFVEKLGAVGVNVPIVAGIMPITNVKQLARIRSISGGDLPGAMISAIERLKDNEDDVFKYGVEYATRQAMELYENGINAVHIYSMNKPRVAREMQKNLKGIVG